MSSRPLNCGDTNSLPPQVQFLLMSRIPTFEYQISQVILLHATLMLCHRCPIARCSDSSNASEGVEDNNQKGETPHGA